MLPGEPSAAPAILLVHGDADTMIPVDAMFMAREALAQAGLAVEWHVAEGIGHGIDPTGFNSAAPFSAKLLPRFKPPPEVARGLRPLHIPDMPR